MGDDVDRPEPPSAKAVTAMLREERSLSRRADKLNGTAAAVEDPTTRQLATEVFDDTAIELRSRGIPVLTLDEGHMAHLTNPRRLAALLIEAEHELGTRTGSHDESSLSRS